MMPPELRKLFIRFIELSALLPDPDNFDPGDPQAVAKTTLILRELAKVNDEIKKFGRCSVSLTTN
jgi:hypothetical protein